MLRGQGAVREELFHQFILALGHRLHQLVVGLLGGFGILGGDGDLFALAVSVGRVNMRGHSDQVDHPAKVALLPDGDLNRHRRASEDRVDALQRPIEARPFPIQLVDHEGARQAVLLGEAPDLLGLNFHPRHAIH